MSNISKYDKCDAYSWFKICSQNPMIRACCFCPFQILRGLSDKTAELRAAATLQSFPAFFVWAQKTHLIWNKLCKFLIVSLEVWYLLILYHIKFHIELPIAPGRGCKVLWWSSNELGRGVVACWAAKQNGVCACVCCPTSRWFVYSITDPYTIFASMPWSPCPTQMKEAQDVVETNTLFLPQWRSSESVLFKWWFSKDFSIRWWKWRFADMREKRASSKVRGSFWNSNLSHENHLGITPVFQVSQRWRRAVLSEKVSWHCDKMREFGVFSSFCGSVYGSKVDSVIGDRPARFFVFVGGTWDGAEWMVISTPGLEDFYWKAATGCW